MKKNFLIILIILFSLKAQPSFAYLDPGTGGSILQIIMAFIAAAGASISLYYKRIKFFLKKLFSKKTKDK